jgi:hypothetical protein
MRRASSGRRGEPGFPDLSPARRHRSVIPEGWRPRAGGRPRVLTERAYAEARQLFSRGGWKGLDRATIEAVRGGAQPGDALPPEQPKPFITDVTEPEVVITGSGEGRRVAVLFSHRHFPGLRFGHRFPPDPHAECREQIWLMEEIDNGALHRMMEDRPPPTAAASSGRLGEIQPPDYPGLDRQPVPGARSSQ